MTPEQQRLAIAEACPFVDRASIERGEPRYWDCNGNFVEFDPVYDLNAMHAAWLTFDQRERDVFAGYLSEVFSGRRDFGACRIDCTTAILGATAAQRAEAFVRVIGKWQDTPAPLSREEDMSEPLITLRDCLDEINHALNYWYPRTYNNASEEERTARHERLFPFRDRLEKQLRDTPAPL